MKLYHLTTRAGEARILKSGFSDEDRIHDDLYLPEDDSIEDMDGVLFDDTEDCEAWKHVNEGVFLSSLKIEVNGRGVVCIDIPDDIAQEYENLDKRHPEAHHWTIPNGVANRYIVRPAR